MVLWETQSSRYTTVMAREHQPLEAVQVTNTERLFFLAGPIQGAPDWQREGFRLIEESFTDSSHIHVANPRREYLDGTFNYSSQVDWEKLHLWRAAHSGGTLFWIPRQDFSLDYEAGRPYAKTTAQELQRYAGWLMYDPKLPISIGIEPGCEFDSQRYFRHTADEFQVPVLTSLDDVVANLLEQRANANI